MTPHPEPWHDADDLPADWTNPPPARRRQTVALVAAVVITGTAALAAGYQLGRADAPPPPPPVVLPVTPASCADAAARGLGEQIEEWTTDDPTPEETP